MITSNYPIVFFILLFLGFKSFSQTPPPHTHGQWGPKIEFDIVPVALANLPDGRLVTWSSKYHDAFGGDDGYTFTQIFDPTILDTITGHYGAVLPSTVTDTNHDMFCPGINNLADGRLLVTGGSSDEKTSIYDPKTEKWTKADDMLIARGYQGAVTLSDGSAFTIGGSWSGGPAGGRDAEIWKEGTWKLLPGLKASELLWNTNDSINEPEGVYRLDNHAWLWAAPNGKIFHAGPGEEMHWIDVNGNGGNGSYTSAGPNGKRGDDTESMNGNTVMFDVGKILKVGGSGSYSSGSPSNENSYVIDFNNEANVLVTPTANMQHARVYVSSVALPNGEVLVLGGLNRAVVFWDQGAHLSAEMYDPEKNEFRTLASMTVPRTYHSAGILLPDGRVFMGGGGLCGNCGDRNHKDAEVFSPPYLFNSSGQLATRPTVSAPDNAFYGIDLTVTASSDVTEFSFVRMSSATHSINNEQRRIPVNFTVVDGYHHLEIPNANIMPPGYYMLFALNGDGVPSISEAVLVGTQDDVRNSNLLVEFDFFEGNGALVYDSSGNENHGTIKEREDNGDPVVSLTREYWSANGLSGNALEMNGIEHLSNTILEVPASETLSALTNQYTVSVWVNRDTGSVVPGTTRVPNVSIFAHDYPQSFFMGYHGPEFKVEFRTTTGGHFNAYTGALYTPGEWEHFASTYDGNTAKVFVNGVRIFEQPVSGNLRLTNDDNPFSTFTLSGFYDRRTGTTLPGYANNSGITDELDGRMDNFKLYNIALTEEEIKDIYLKEIDVILNTGPCDDIALIYEINGIKNNGMKEISVLAGDDVALYLDPEFADYTITRSDGTVLNSNILDNIIVSQSDTYTVSYVIEEKFLARNVKVDYVSSWQGSENGQYERPGANAVDGNSATMWHTPWTPSVTPHPHYIDLDLGVESSVSGLEYLPRQDKLANGNPELNGTIENYEIYVSNSTTDWGDPVKTGTWDYDQVLKEEDFSIKQGRYVRLKSLFKQVDRPWASAAEIRVRTSVITECEKTIKINVQKPITYTYDGGWQPTDPSGESRMIDDIIIETGEATITRNTQTNNVTINPGAVLYINENDVILTVNTTILNSTSTSFASLIYNGWITGEVQYNRFVNKVGDSLGGGNDLISSPIEGANFDKAFVTANPKLPENMNNKGEFGFAPYNVSTGKYENFYINADHSGEFPIISGKGYRAATVDNDTLSFKGRTTRNPIEIAISDASEGRAWNLIGNPYPSYLDFNEFFIMNKEQFDSRDAYQAIYGYTGASNDWTVWNQALIDDPNITTSIAPGQGFFVKSKSGGGIVQFTPEMRIAGTTDDFVIGRPANKNVALSKLKLSTGNNNVLTSIYFIGGTTRGLDPGYDAATYSATAVDFSIFTNLLEDHKGLDIAIQSLPYNDFNNVIVPLGIKAKAGAELNISIDELSTIPSNINVYIEDTQNNTLTLLNDAAYTFTPTTDLDGSGRFNVHYTARTLSVGDLDLNDNLRIYTTASPKTLFIKGQLSKVTIANLYDIQGRIVLSKMLNPNITENTMDISTVSSGVYVVKVNNDNQIKTQKVIIK